VYSTSGWYSLRRILCCCCCHLLPPPLPNKILALIIQSCNDQHQSVCTGTEAGATHDLAPAPMAQDMTIMFMFLYGQYFKKLYCMRWAKHVWFCYAIFNSHMFNAPRLNSEKHVSLNFFYFKWGHYMCGAPERLTAFGARTFLVLSQQ
jgi:hypothetical protein